MATRHGGGCPGGRGLPTTSAWIPRLQQGQLGKTNAKDALAAAWAVAKTARNPVEAGFRLLKMAAAGKRFLAGHNYSAHYTVEGVCQAEVNAKLALLRKAMEGVGTRPPTPSRP